MITFLRLQFQRYKTREKVPQKWHSRRTFSTSTSFLAFSGINSKADNSGRNHNQFFKFESRERMLLLRRFMTLVVDVTENKMKRIKLKIQRTFRNEIFTFILRIFLTLQY